VSADRDAMSLWAVLFAAGRSVPRRRLLQVLGLDEAALGAAAAALEEHLDATGAPLCLERVGSGYQLLLRPAYHLVARMLVGEAPARLSPAALETLAVVAYGQPAARAAVEAARGVRAERALGILAERGLVREVPPPRGALPDDGPYYATTREFLDAFGLAALSDLPPWPGGPPAPRQAALPLAQGPEGAPPADLPG
jgi:segregation and condensation protein B